MRVFAWFAVLALVLVSSATDAAGPTCSAYQQRVAPNSPQCFEAATSLQDDDIVYGVQGTGPTRSNQSVKIPVSQLKEVAAGSAPVQSVAGRDGDVTLSTTDISGLGTIATQSAASVAITGGTVTGAAVSGAVVTATGSTTARTLADRFADTVNLKDCGAVGDNSTDDSAALAACVGIVNTKLAAGVPAVLRVPAGVYLIGTASAIPTFVRGGSVVGDGPHRSLFRLDAAFSGDLFSWSESWAAANTSYTASTLNISNDKSGVVISNIGVIGNQTATGQQNAFNFYDRNDFVNMHDVEIWYVHGYAIAIGAYLKNTGQAYMRESHFKNVFIWGSGTSSIPAMLISTYTNTGGDSTNQLQFHELHLVGSQGKGLVINNDNSAAGVRLIQFFGLRLEGNVAGDLLTIGDATMSGNVNNIDIYGLSANGSPSGYNTILFQAPSGSLAPYAITIHGAIASGAGNGINIQAGRLLRLRFPVITTTGTNVIVGATPKTGGPIIIDGYGAEQSFTYSVDGTASTVLLKPAYNISYQNTVNGAVSAALGGQLALINGAYSVTLGGYTNWVDKYASVVSGVRGYNRGRQIITCMGGDKFAEQGDAQTCYAPLKGSGSGSTIRITSSGTTAAADNVYNLSADGLAFSLSCDVVVKNTATNDAANFHSGNMLLRRKTGAASVTLNGGTSAVTLTQDNAEGTLSGVLTVTAAPDTTNSGLNLSVAQTGSLSLRAVASCRSVEVQ